jgi:hypothetical protein
MVEQSMKWPTLKCPFCGGILPNTEVYPDRPLVCPTCAAQLQSSEHQLWLSGFIALCITLAALYFLGLRGAWFAFATILLWFPVYVFWDFIFLRIVPPRFESYHPKDHRGKLFGDEPPKAP